eukprot:471177-Amorphochlora_amoeboformis.AAC.1
MACELASSQLDYIHEETKREKLRTIRKANADIPSGNIKIIDSMVRGNVADELKRALGELSTTYDTNMDPMMVKKLSDGGGSLGGKVVQMSMDLKEKGLSSIETFKQVVKRCLKLIDWNKDIIKTTVSALVDFCRCARVVVSGAKLLFVYLNHHLNSLKNPNPFDVSRQCKLDGILQRVVHFLDLNTRIRETSYIFRILKQVEERFIVDKLASLSPVVLTAVQLCQKGSEDIQKGVEEIRGLVPDRLKEIQSFVPMPAIPTLAQAQTSTQRSQFLIPEKLPNFQDMWRRSRIRLKPQRRDSPDHWIGPEGDGRTPSEQTGFFEDYLAGISHDKANRSAKLELIATEFATLQGLVKKFRSDLTEFYS